MSIVLKTTELKYKDSNDDYIGINAIAETTLTQQLQAIQDASDAAQSIIPSADTLNSLSNDFASQYSSSKSYKVGDYVVVDYELYRCIHAISAPGESWDEHNWELTSVTNYLNDIKIQTYHTSVLDFSEWDNGVFTETLDNSITTTYEVQFDASDRPILITDTDGQEMEIIWDAV